MKTARIHTPAAVVAVLAARLIHGAVSPGTEFHVAPDGNDAHAGTATAPFATVARARDAVRALKQAAPLASPVTILLHGGTYFLVEPLIFTPEDSGTPTCPVTYAAAPGEHPVLSGGTRIAGWRRTNDNLWVADVPWLKERPEAFTELFSQGERRPLARTPNEGSYFYTTRLTLTQGHPGQCLGVTYERKDALPWIERDGVRVVLFHNWVNSYNRVAKVDRAKRRIVFARPAGIFFLGPAVRYYVENCRDALDAPGEWYADRAAGRLYYYPPPGENPAQADLVVPRLGASLLVFEGDPAHGAFVEHLVFRGLSFQHTDADLSPAYPHSVQGAHTQRGALFATGLRHARIERCEFAHLGEHGVSLRAGCASNAVRECRFRDMGGGGVYLSEGSPAHTNDWYLTAYNTIDNNLIYDGGRIFRAGCGVFLGGSASYNAITHNEICDLSWMGVHAGWSWTGRRPAYTHHNNIGYNHIHHIGNGVLNDIGGIYTLGVSPGTVLHHNRIHDVTRFERGREGYGGWGIYLDAGSSLIRVENNVVYDTRDGGLHLHNHSYPYGDTVTNNIFAFSQDAELIRNAAMDADRPHVTLERNIVYGPTARILGGSNWAAGKGFSADFNCYWSTTTNAPDFGGRSFAAWQSEGRDPHGIVADPRFVNPDSRDFTLHPDSAAKTLGFVPIDVSAAGLYGDPAWTGQPRTIRHRTPETAVLSPSAQWVHHTFEDEDVGELPDYTRVSEDNAQAVARVSDEQAAGGRQSLKFLDGPAQPHSYNPHVYYLTDFPAEPLRGAFDLYHEPGAIVSYEWRDWPHGEPLRAGPGLRVSADGVLTAGGRKLMTIPENTWVHFEVLCNTGPAADARWQLTVQPAGADSRHFPALGCSPDFKRLNWVGFCALSTNQTVFYVDDVVIEPAPTPHP